MSSNTKLQRWWSSGLLHDAQFWLYANVSEEHTTSIFKKLCKPQTLPYLVRFQVLTAASMRCCAV
jgi:predicted hydrolase (HD superfamily)